MSESNPIDINSLHNIVLRETENDSLLEIKPNFYRNLSDFIGNLKKQEFEGVENKIKESSFYLALQISYPNPWDIRRALSLNKHPGGQIMIHGLPNITYDKDFHNKQNDWTEGCIAVTNSEMDFLWKIVDIGTPVFIRK